MEKNTRSDEGGEQTIGNGDRELCVVEVPLFFDTKEKAKRAIEMFGGTKALEDVDRGERTELKLYLRPSDHNCHPIEALPNRKKKKKKKKCIVVKMSRNSASNSIRRAVVVGSVATHYMFQDHADFQIIGPSMDKPEGMETPWNFMDTEDTTKSDIAENSTTDPNIASASVQVKESRFISRFRIPKRLCPTPPCFLMSSGLRDKAVKEKAATAVAPKLDHARHYGRLFHEIQNRLLTKKGSCCICYAEDNAVIHLQSCNHDVCVGCMRSYCHAALGDISMSLPVWKSNIGRVT